MAAETAQLTYAVPLAVGETLHHQGDDGVRFELGPVPTEIFVARILGEALYTTLLAGIMLLMTPRVGGWGLAMVVVSLWAVSLTITVLRVTRHRLTSRVVGATSENLFHSGPHTHGELLSIPRSDIESIGVRRSWRRPWVFELVAVRRAPPFWSVTNKPHGPVVLLIDLDHAVVASMAAALRDTPGSAAPTPCPP